VTGLGWRQVVVLACVMGLVAAAVVWWLERFEVARLHESFRSYLDKVDAFRAWEAEHGDA
jgi:predicted MFS family arabinose efflux permease